MPTKLNRSVEREIDALIPGTGKPMVVKLYNSETGRPMVSIRAKGGRSGTKISFDQLWAYLHPSGGPRPSNAGPRRRAGEEEE